MGTFAKEVDVKKSCTIAPASFQGCIPESICADVLTYACPDDADPPTPYEFFDSCLPPGFTPCPAPELKGDCK